MKILKGVLIILFVVCCFNVSFAADVRQMGRYPMLNNTLRTATFVITADGSGNVEKTAFLDAPGNIYGWYIMTVEMTSATEDIFTVLISTYAGATTSTAGGVELFNYTTATADTTGDIESVKDRYPIYATPYIDVTGLPATEVCRVVVTFVR
jgi:hypothetical protein